ncbi:hypothetical protein GCM10027284_46820 [Cyclobacterium sediminis]
MKIINYLTQYQETYIIFILSGEIERVSDIYSFEILPTLLEKGQNYLTKFQLQSI